MPYAQNAADRAHALKLNTTSEFLWDALIAGADENKLLQIAAREFDAQEDEIALLQQDIGEFLSVLIANGVLVDSDSTQEDTGFQPLYYRIGPLTFAYYGPAPLYEQYFSAFVCEEIPNVNQRIYIHIGRPRINRNGTILIRTSELLLFENSSEYRMLFQKDWGIYEMVMQKDAQTVTLYCAGSAFDNAHIEQVFHALRFAFLLLAQKNGLYTLHSASFAYRNHAWLFSGPSGTGKSTHTNLWHTLYDVPLLNGDLNIIGIKDGLPVVYGLPWCGTSGICSTDTYPLGGIVFLKQAPVNRIQTPPAEEQSFLLMQRLISPVWDSQMLMQQADFAQSLSKLAPMVCLDCTKDNEAAATMKDFIDKL